MRGPAGALRAGDPARALRLAREQLARNDQDAKSWRDLGVALVRLRRPAEALDPLERALTLEPGERSAMFFRARALDRLDRLGGALAAYEAYAATAPASKQADLVRGRIEQIHRARIAAQVRDAFAREDSLRAAVPPENTIAVLDFTSSTASDPHRAIAKGLAWSIARDLGRIPRLHVIERRRLLSLLEELRRRNPEAFVAAPSQDAGVVDPVTTVRGQQQRLSALTDPNTGKLYYEGRIDGLLGARFSAAVLAFQRANLLEADGVAGTRTQITLERVWQAQKPPGAQDPSPEMASAFDPRTTPRLARLLGARRIARGTVVAGGGSGLEARAEIEDVVAPRLEGLLATEPITGELTDLLRLEKELALSLLRLLGVTLTPEERRALEEQETGDVEAFLAFCRGLDLEDRGRNVEAIAAYREAAARDPGLEAARIHATALDLEPGALLEAEEREIESLSVERTDRRERTPGLADRPGLPAPGFPIEPAASRARLP
jgi:tetratricopeptide (TPR) repeat protein